MNKFLIQKKDNSVSIMNIIAGDIDSEVAKWPEEVRVDVISYRAIEDTDIPTDRTFRSAWRDELEGEQIDICLRSAKELALLKLRAERNKKLDELDKQTLIAIGKGDDAMRQAVEEKKRDLRDCTEPLKAVEAVGYNDEATLNRLKELMTLPEV